MVRESDRGHAMHFPSALGPYYAHHSALKLRTVCMRQSPSCTAVSVNQIDLTHKIVESCHMQKTLILAVSFEGHMKHFDVIRPRRNTNIIRLSFVGEVIQK